MFQNANKSYVKSLQSLYIYTYSFADAFIQSDFQVLYKNCNSINILLLLELVLCKTFLYEYEFLWPEMKLRGV